MTAIVSSFSPRSLISEELLITPSKLKLEVNPWDSNQYGILSPPFDSSAWPVISPNGRTPSLPYALQRAINTRNDSNSSDDQFIPRNLTQLKSEMTSPLHSPSLPSPALSPITFTDKSIASSPTALCRSSVSSDTSTIPFIHAVATVGYKFPLQQSSIKLPQETAEPTWEEGDTSIALRTPLAKSLDLRRASEPEKKVDLLAEYRLDRADGPCKPFITKLAHLCWRTELYEDVIKWDSTGTCFLVAPSEKFLTKVLPDIFSHSSFTAFTRQLKTYGFRHLTPQQVETKFKYSPDTTTPVRDLSAWQHPLFTRDNPGNLNRLLPKPSAARKLHAQQKMAAVSRMGRLDD